MLKTTDNEGLSTQAIENKKNQDTPSAIGGADGGNVGGSIKNLSTTGKSAISKNPILIKPKSSNLIKAYSSGIDFLTSKAKKAFIHLRKAFTKALILRHFDP